MVSGNLFQPALTGNLGMQAALHDSVVSGNDFEGGGVNSCYQIFGSQFSLVPSDTVEITANTFNECNVYGIQLSPDIDNITIHHNTFTDSYEAVNTRDSTAWDLTGKNIHVTENSITGSTHFGVRNGETGTLDASGNWWGTYSATAVAALMSGTVDYTPWHHYPTDLSPSAGFQGDFSLLHVDDNSPQAGATGRIQEGVNLVTGGGAVRVEAGIYDEQVVIDGKDLALFGVGGTSIIRPSSPTTLTTNYTYEAGTFWPGVVMSSVIMVTDSDDVTVKDLKVDGVHLTTCQPAPRDSPASSTATQAARSTT